MGYLHIDNLYRIPELLECYALEKIHGTSANVHYKAGRVGFFSGGENHSNFVSLFDEPSLVSAFASKFIASDEVWVYGEAFRKDGSRVIAKHKRPEFRETKTPREVDPARVAVMLEAEAIAEEYVTRMRLAHVLQKTPYASERDTGAVIRAMQDDVEREAGGDIVWSKDVAKAVGKATVALLQQMPEPSIH